MWCVIGCQMSLTGTMSTRRARPDRPVKVRQRTREVLGCTQRGDRKMRGRLLLGTLPGKSRGWDTWRGLRVPTRSQCDPRRDHLGGPWAIKT